MFNKLPADEEKAKVFAEKLQFLNDHLLKQGEWLTGDTPTIADISIGCSLTMPGFYFFYRKDLEKQEGCGVVAHERLTEPRVTEE